MLFLSLGWWIVCLEKFIFLTAENLLKIFVYLQFPIVFGLGLWENPHRGILNDSESYGYWVRWHGFESQQKSIKAFESIFLFIMSSENVAWDLFEDFFFVFYYYYLIVRNIQHLYALTASSIKLSTICKITNLLFNSLILTVWWA